MTLKWAIDQKTGKIEFGRMIPVTGNTYKLIISGQSEGTNYTFYVMDDDSNTCLAKSDYNLITGEYFIAFNLESLRDRFQKRWHEIRVFHTVVSDGENTVAEGDLSICWNPVWTLPEVGEAYSMRGPRGYGIERISFDDIDEEGNYIFRLEFENGNYSKFTAPRGPAGMPGRIGYVHSTDNNKWYQLSVKFNTLGQPTIELSQTGIDEPPVDAVYLTVADIQTISGAKTFNGTTLVPEIDNLQDDSRKAAPTKWVRRYVQDKLTSWWQEIRSAVITFSNKIIANDGIDGNVTGDVTGAVTVPAQKAFNASAATEALVPTIADDESSLKAAPSSWVQRLVAREFAKALTTKLYTRLITDYDASGDTYLKASQSFAGNYVDKETNASAINDAVAAIAATPLLTIKPWELIREGFQSFPAPTIVDWKLVPNENGSHTVLISHGLNKYAPNADEDVEDPLDFIKPLFSTEFRIRMKFTYAGTNGNDQILIALRPNFVGHNDAATGTIDDSAEFNGCEFYINNSRRICARIGDGANGYSQTLTPSTGLQVTQDHTYWVEFYHENNNLKFKYYDSTGVYTGEDAFADCYGSFTSNTISTTTVNPYRYKDGFGIGNRMTGFEALQDEGEYYFEKKFENPFNGTIYLDHVKIVTLSNATTGEIATCYYHGSEADTFAVEVYRYGEHARIFRYEDVWEKRIQAPQLLTLNGFVLQQFDEPDDNRVYSPFVLKEDVQDVPDYISSTKPYGGYLVFYRMK